MNYKEKLNGTLLKSMIRRRFPLAIFYIFLIINSCDNKEEFLKVVNEDKDGCSITSVRFVGYEFNNLLISSGSSQTFTLDKGMSGGYYDINVIVSFGPPSRSSSAKINFNKDKTTIITLKGCISYEGCKGHYLSQ